jgi:predicted RNA polymerase sigma factor
LIDATNLSKSDLSGSALKSWPKSGQTNDPSSSTARRGRLDELALSNFNLHAPKARTRDDEAKTDVMKPHLTNLRGRLM